MAGCSTLGLNSYSGTVQNGVYYNKISNVPNSGSFSVQIPQLFSSGGDTDLQISDTSDSRETMAIFGPNAFDLTQYSVVVLRAKAPIPEADMADAKDKLMQFYAQNLISNSNGKIQLSKIYQKDFTFDSMPARYVVYTYPIPAGALGWNMPQGTGTDATLIVIYPKYGVILDMVAFDLGSDSPFQNDVTDKNRDQVIDMTLPVLKDYFNSFTILSNS